MDASPRQQYSNADSDDAPLEAERALNALWWVVSLANDWTPDECHEILHRFSPFLDRRFVDGSKTRHQSDSILMLIWAAVGDAHRELGEIAASAEAYRHACEFRPNRAYGDFYADIALKHNLKEHYEMALRSLEVGAQEWAKYDKGLRAYAHFWSFARAPLGYLRNFKHVFQRKRRIRELRRRLMEGSHQVRERTGASSISSPIALRRRVKPALLFRYS